MGSLHFRLKPGQMRTVSEYFRLDVPLSWESYSPRMILFRGIHGPPSLIQGPVFLAFSVPSLPPQNVTARNTSSTALLVTWDPVPLRHAHGVVRGYRVLIESTEVRGGHSRSFTTGPDVLSSKLGGLEKFTRYNITVLAFTRIGDGERARNVLVSTDEDGLYDVMAYNCTFRGIM